MKKYITLFNGDPNRVTVAGQSAGAASILHHLISYAGGKLSFGSNRPDPPAFQRAIIQSPAFFPLADDKQEESIYNNFLGSSGTDNVEDLRAADTNILQYVNSVMIQSSDYGQFTFGPSVDDLLIPAPASLLLGRGIKWPNIQILVGDTINEGLLFSPPNVASDSEFRSLISKKLPGMKKADIDEVLRMYPIDAKSTPAQRTQRVANAISELGVVCNTRYLLEAYRGGYNYNYKFGVHPGFHGQDAFFTVSLLLLFDGISLASSHILHTLVQIHTHRSTVLRASIHKRTLYRSSGEFLKSDRWYGRGCPGIARLL